MSGVNIACNIGNQMGEYLVDVTGTGRAAPLGRGAGEMKVETGQKEQKEPKDAAVDVAADVVNEIIENALDIATMGDVAFSVDDGVCAFPAQLAKALDVQEAAEEAAPQIRDLIDGLSAIRVPGQNAEEPARLDAEMKRLLDEMMSPPYDVVNYEAIPRKDGVGDQPVDDAQKEAEVRVEPSDDCLVDADRIKVVEKKTRVTDLVMNSKQVLTELLMSEETRSRQAEWEEDNESVLQVIELDCVKPEEGVSFKLKKPDVPLAPVTQGESLVSVDLAKKDDAKAKTAAVEDNPEDDTSLAGSSYSRGSDDNGKERFKSKFENLRKKWNINFKFFAFGKRKQKAKEEKAKL